MPMNQVKQTGPSGIARIALSKLGKWIVTLEETNERFEILTVDAPEYLTVPGRYSVMLSQDMLRLVSVRPVGGTHFAQFVGFRRQENSPTPVPSKNPGGLNFFGKYEDPFLEFTAEFIIVDGEYKDFPLSLKMRYVFTPSPDRTETFYGGSGQKKVVEFLQVMGFNLATDTLPWSENVLPDLEAMLIRNNVGPIMIELNEKGFPDHLAPLPAGISLKPVKLPKAASKATTLTKAPVTKAPVKTTKTPVTKAPVTKAPAKKSAVEKPATKTLKSKAK